MHISLLPAGALQVNCSSLLASVMSCSKNFAKLKQFQYQSLATYAYHKHGRNSGRQIELSPTAILYDYHLRANGALVL